MSDDNITSLGSRRFYATDRPADSALEDAFSAARDYIKETGAVHVVICIGRHVDEVNGSGTKYFQAGKYRFHETIGLLHSVIHQMLE